MSFNKVINELMKQTGKSEYELIKEYGIDKGMSKMEQERRGLGMSIPELARRSTVSKNTIAKYEQRNGLNGANCEYGLLIAKVLGKPLEELLDNFEYPDALKNK